MKDIVGQISLTDLMDIFSPQQKPEEPPILLHEGQRVYKVVRGDVEEHIVTGEKSWVCGENNRGYRLKRISGCWDVTWNSSVGVNVFTDLQVANAKAEKYIAENDCILTGNIKAKEVVAYRHVYNGMEIINFYAVLDNGMIYYNYGSMYEHIGDRKEIAKFEEKMRECMERNVCEEIVDYQPVFNNMYKCNGSGWKYAAARYQYINA